MNAESLHAEQDLPHVLYYENDLPVNSGFQCGTSDVHPTDIEAVSLVAPDTIFSNHCKTIKVFWNAITVYIPIEIARKIK